MGMGIGVGDGEGEGLRPEFTPYYRTPRKEAMQLRGEIDDADVESDADHADADVAVDAEPDPDAGCMNSHLTTAHLN